MYFYVSLARTFAADYRNTNPHIASRFMVSRIRLALCACVALAAAAIARAVDTHVFYYNDVTRESRWDDPEGLATHLDDAGRPYWVDANTGESTYDSPRHTMWHALVSEDEASAGQVYYVHKETQETTWTKPEELAWRRIEQEVDAHDKWQREQAQGEKDVGEDVEIDGDTIDVGEDEIEG